jgi:hypothetical protein
MGGPGFLGLKCGKNRKTFWMVSVLWGAEGWLTLNGKLIASSLSEAEKKRYARQGGFWTEANSYSNRCPSSRLISTTNHLMGFSFFLDCPKPPGL